VCPLRAREADLQAASGWLFEASPASGEARRRVGRIQARAAEAPSRVGRTCGTPVCAPARPTRLCFDYGLNMTARAQSLRNLTAFEAILGRGTYPGPNAFALLAAFLVGAAGMGAALALEPRTAVLPLGVLASAVLLVDGRVRVVFVVFGGLVIFQTDEGLTLSKLAFLTLATVAFAGALHNVLRPRLATARALCRPLLVTSSVFGGLAAVSFVVADNSGTPLSSWVRDVSPYLLFVSAPVFAIDAAASLGRRRLVTLLVAAGVFGAVAFAVGWLHRRGIADLPITRVGLASIFLPAALFSYGMAYVLQVMRARWLILSAVVFALLLATGTRTNLALLAAPLAITLASRHNFTIRSLRLAVILPVMGAATLGLVLIALNLANANVDKLFQRLNVLASTGTASDYSYVERLRQVDAAIAVFQDNLLAGAGPGTTFEWIAPNGVTRAAFVLDTSVTYPAKFGVVGLAALAVAVLAYLAFSRSLGRLEPLPLGYLALVGYLGVALVASLGYSPFEDKGFALGLILMLAIALADAGVAPATSRDTLGYGMSDGRQWMAVAAAEPRTSVRASAASSHPKLP
jgi:hypothetical protein